MGKAKIVTAADLTKKLAKSLPTGSVEGGGTGDFIMGILGSINDSAKIFKDIMGTGVNLKKQYQELTGQEPKKIIQHQPVRAVEPAVIPPPPPKYDPKKEEPKPSAQELVDEVKPTKDYVQIAGQIFDEARAQVNKINPALLKTISVHAIIDMLDKDQSGYKTKLIQKISEILMEKFEE